jgi:hypothetical protein
MKTNEINMTENKIKANVTKGKDERMEQGTNE